MAQEAIERAPSTPWQRNPFFYVRDLIANDPKFTDRARSTTLLNLEDLRSMCGTHPSQQTMGAAAGYFLGVFNRLIAESSDAKRDTTKGASRDLASGRAIDQYAKCARLAGLSAKGPKRAGGKKRASMFTAPRVKTDADQRALDGPPLVTDEA